MTEMEIRRSFLNVWQMTIFTTGLYITYRISLVLYRCFLHPLSKVPGPILAGATFLPELWYNIVKKGSYYKKIEEWHGIYGPIVRITPEEVHFSDPSIYDKIYYVGSPYTKDLGLYESFGATNGLFTASSNAVHRRLRTPLNPLFSHKAVHDLEWLVQAHVDVLCRRIEKSDKSPGEGFDLHNALRCVSVDVISEYAFAQCFHLLDTEDFGKSKFFKMIRQLAGSIWVFRHFPLVRLFALNTPLWLAERADEATASTARLQHDSMVHIQNIKDHPEEFSTRYKTIFHEYLYPTAAEDKGRAPPSIESLADTTVTFVVAASETTGNGMEVTLFHILESRDIHVKLVAELRDAFPDSNEPISLLVLERLPYLTACIKEGLRLSYGVLGRLPRCVAEDNVEFYGYHLPRGTVVSQMAWMMHRNIKLFPDPEKFIPERWIGDRAERLERYLVPFSRGPRMCIGMNLAWAELYITTGRLIRQFDLRLSEKSAGRYEYQDYFSSFQPEESAGLRVKISQ